MLIIASICMWNEQAGIVSTAHDFYCCVLPQCETLHSCCSSPPITLVHNMTLTKSINILQHHYFAKKYTFYFMSSVVSYSHFLASCFIWFVMSLNCNLSNAKTLAGNKNISISSKSDISQPTVFINLYCWLRTKPSWRCNPQLPSRPWSASWSLFCWCSQ